MSSYTVIKSSNIIIKKKKTIDKDSSICRQIYNTLQENKNNTISLKQSSSLFNSFCNDLEKLHIDKEKQYIGIIPIYISPLKTDYNQNNKSDTTINTKNIHISELYVKNIDGLLYYPSFERYHDFDVYSYLHSVFNIESVNIKNIIQYTTNTTTYYICILHTLLHNIHFNNKKTFIHTYNKNDIKNIHKESTNSTNSTELSTIYNAILHDNQYNYFNDIYIYSDNDKINITTIYKHIY